MKVIFLDIDNVLNAQFTRERFDGYVFVMDSKIELLKQLVDRTGARVVLSSTWREGWADLKAGLDTRDSKLFIALRDKLLEHGIELLDYTPVTGGGMLHRGEEITLWFQSWQGEAVESYVILDDLNGRYLRPHAGRLVRTSIEKGLLPKHVELAVQILERPLEKNRPEEPAKLCRYYWTEDGIPELCEVQEYTLTEENWCYHCDRKLLEGEKVVGLIAEDGDEYVLCPECAKKACEKA